MEKTMPRLPTMEKAVTESPCQKVPRWRQPSQRVPRGRTPGRGDYPENVMTQRTPLESSAMEKTGLESCILHEIMPGSPTME